MKESWFFLVFLLAISTIAGCEDKKKNNNINNTNNTNNVNNTNNTNNINNTNNTNNATCGDNQVQPPELCDGQNLNAATCQTLGYDGGELACAADCLSFDTHGCTGDPGPYGFVIRQPQTRQLECANSGLQQFRDADHICTFADGEMAGYIYFQATPTACISLFSDLPEYTTVAWISQNGVVAQLPAASYDFGGNHHNDFFDFTLPGGQKYQYFHSSFGWGWRACQPMDCMKKLDAQNQVTQDGCTPERTLPVVCRPIEDDGTFGELVDDFEKCPGDPNAK